MNSLNNRTRPPTIRRIRLHTAILTLPFFLFACSSDSEGDTTDTTTSATESADETSTDTQTDPSDTGDGDSDTSGDGDTGDGDTSGDGDAETGEDVIVYSEAAFGDYERVDRAGMPAVNTALITSKNAYNLADPVDDIDPANPFVAEIVASIDGLHAALDGELTGLGLTPCASADCVAQGGPLVLPDTLKVDTQMPAGFPNGRTPSDPVMDITLAVLLLDLGVHTAVDLVGVNPPENDVAFDSEFPYLADPH